MSRMGIRWGGTERRRPRVTDRRASHNELWNIAIWTLFAIAWFVAGFITSEVLANDTSYRYGCEGRDKAGEYIDCERVGQP